jgi:hypothetical protein
MPRWDYYKEIGAPPINNDDDYIAVLKAMQAKHPTTKTGKKTYAIAVEFNLGDMGGYRAATTRTDIALNVWSFSGTRYATDVYTGKPVNGYTNLERSHYWADMHFYNKIYREGLFDPDIFSMNGDAYGAKLADGVYMADYYRQDNLYNAEVKTDPQSMAYYIPVPSTAAYAYANKPTALGGFPQEGRMIPKTTKHVEKALEVLNFLYDPDNVRIRYWGDKGVYWDYDAGGKPYIFPKALEDRVASPVLPGLDDARYNQMPWRATAIHPDGAYYDLINEKEYKGLGLIPPLQDFCAYYGITYPAEAQYNLFKQGKVKDMSNDDGSNITGYMAMPTDIRRTSEAVKESFERAMPRLVQSNTDAEFLHIQNEVLAAAKAAGEDTVWQWITTEFNRLEKIITPLYEQVKPFYIHK